MSDLGGPPHTGLVTLREVYALVEKVRGEVLAEVSKVSAVVESRLEVHQQEHQLDNQRRSGLIRWAVTSVLSGLGVLAALYVAFASR